MTTEEFDVMLEPASSWRALGDPSHLRDRWVLTLEARRPDVPTAVLAQAVVNAQAITREVVLIRVGEAFDKSRALSAALARRDAPSRYASAGSVPPQPALEGNGCSGRAGAERYWASYVPHTDAQIASAITDSISDSCLIFAAEGIRAPAVSEAIVQTMAPGNERFALLRAALAVAHPRTLFVKADKQFDDPPAIILIGPKDVTAEAQIRIESAAATGSS